MSRQHSLQTVVQLVIIALSSAMKEQHDMKNVKSSRKKRWVGECKQARVGVEKATMIVGDPHDNRRLYPESKTTPIDTPNDENVNSFEKGEFQLRRPPQSFPAPNNHLGKCFPRLSLQGIEMRLNCEK